MQRINTPDIAETLVSEISTDASHFRTEEDRLYLSGIEVALIIATGALNSFVLGLLEGAKESLKKQGKEVGRNIVDGFINKLRSIGNKIIGIDVQHGEEAVGELKKHQADIDEVINDPTVRNETTRLLEAPESRALDEMQDFLKKIGYPQDIVQERAQRLVTRILSEWPKN